MIAYLNLCFSLTEWSICVFCSTIIVNDYVLFFFQLNRVYVIFDQPTSVSMIKIWNYSKNANRGAKDFAVSILCTST